MNTILTRKIAVGGLAIVAIATALIGINGSVHAKLASPAVSHVAVTPTPAVLTYHGSNGKTALTLLESSATTYRVKGDGVNAFVTSINGYAASDAKKEFWSLYINGQAATVGAGTLMTTDADTLRWQIDTY